MAARDMHRFVFLFYNAGTMANSSFHDSSSSSNGSCGNKSPSTTRVNKNICIPPPEVTTDHKSLLFQVQLPSAPRNMEVALDWKIKFRMTPMKKISYNKGSQTNPSPPYIIDSDTQSEGMECPANSPLGADGQCSGLSGK